MLANKWWRSSGLSTEQGKDIRKAVELLKKIKTVTGAL